MKAKKTYAERKAEATAMAIEWQHNFADAQLSYGELAYYRDLFYKLGKAFGLLKEFRENGII